MAEPTQEISIAGDAVARRPLWRDLMRWYLILPALVLVATVGIQLYNPFHQEAVVKPKHLAATVPARVPGGWSARDLPLGPTEFVEEVVQQTLRTDDILNREYRRGRVAFGVYAAYWGSGSMPTQLVASHTPDRCWTENGWSCKEMRFNEVYSAGGSPLWPAQWRRFVDPAGGTTYVLFWQLVAGQSYDFGDRFNKIPSPTRWWKDAAQQALFGSREQYFIRVTANVPFEEIWNDPGFQAVLAGLGRLGLVPAAETPSTAETSPGINTPDRTLSLASSNH